MIPRTFDVSSGKGAARRPFSSIIQTCLLFALCMVVMHVILWLALPVWKTTDPLRDFTTRMVSFLLSKLNVFNAVNGYTIVLRNDTWIVTQECTAVNVLILFTSFVLAYTSALRSKLVGLAAGIPFIFAANLTRLVVLGLLTDYLPRQAHFFHDYVWEAIFVILVIAMWLVWIEMVVRREKTPAVPR